MTVHNGLVLDKFSSSTICKASDEGLRGKKTIYYSDRNLAK